MSTISAPQIAAMVEPTTIASAVFSGLNALLLVVRQSAHLAAVDKEVSQLQINVRIADNAVRTARRLVRLNAAALDAPLCADVDRSVEAVEAILALLRDTAEACRRDLETRGTVGWRNRATWLVWRKEEFAGMLTTLTNAMAGLNRDIGRMETCIRLSAATGNFTAPSRYAAKSFDDDGDDESPEDRLLMRRSAFPRAPTRRRARATHKLGEATETASLVSVGETSTLVNDSVSDSSWLAEVEETIRAVGTNARFAPLVPPPLLQVHSAPSQVSLTRSIAMTETSEGEPGHEQLAFDAHAANTGRHNAATSHNNVRWQAPVSVHGHPEVNVNGEETVAARSCFELEGDAVHPMSDAFLQPVVRNRRRRSNFI